jgi:hypothetical protein
MGQDTLLHGRTLFVVPTTDSDHIALPFFTQRVSSNFGGHLLLIESRKVVLIVHFNEFVTARGREGHMQLHLGSAACPGGATKKSKIPLLDGGLASSQCRGARGMGETIGPALENTQFSAAPKPLPPQPLIYSLGFLFFYFLRQGVTL